MITNKIKTDSVVLYRGYKYVVADVSEARQTVALIGKSGRLFWVSLFLVQVQS